MPSLDGGLISPGSDYSDDGEKEDDDDNDPEKLLKRKPL